MRRRCARPMSPGRVGRRWGLTSPTHTLPRGAHELVDLPGPSPQTHLGSQLRQASPFDSESLLVPDPETLDQGNEIGPGPVDKHGDGGPEVRRSGALVSRTD